MRFGINTRLLIKNKLEGIGWFSYETLKRISKEHPEHEFYFFFDKEPDASFIFESNVKAIKLFPPARHPFLYILFFEWAIPRALKKYNIDYFISPDGFIPLRSNIPSLSVIHDINFEHRPEDFSFLTRWYYTSFFPKFARKSNRIATVSNYSKNDIVNTYHISSDKIDVVYNGSNDKYVPISIVDKEKTKLEYTNAEDYFLYVGSLNPRKNIIGLLKSFDLFKQKTNSTIKLLIVGRVMHNNNYFSDTLNNLIFKDDVLFTGHVHSDKLHYIIASAYAMVYVPFFEGFGIPVIEAMYCDTPVITSNVTSLPEVGGEAVLYVNPYEVQSIAEALINLHTNASLRNELISKGRIQRQKFTWDKTSTLLWKSIEKIIY